MNGFQIRNLLKKKGVKVIDIAAQLNVSHSAVSRVIHSSGKSKRIQIAVAAAVNRPVAELFPSSQAGG